MPNLLKQLSFAIRVIFQVLVPFIQFKEREKHPWRSVTFSKVCNVKLETLLKVTLLHGCFPRFPNCTNGIKSRLK